MLLNSQIILYDSIIPNIFFINLSLFTLHSTHMPLIDPKDIEDKCHIKYINMYATFTSILLILNMLHFKSIINIFTANYLLPLQTLLIIVLLLPLLYLCINTKYGVYCYNVIMIIGPFTPCILIFDLAVPYKTLFILLFILFSSRNYINDNYLKSFHKTKFILITTSTEIFNHFHIIYLTYIISNIIFAIYIYFLIFTELVIFKIKDNIYLPTCFLILFAKVFHLYWTFYIIIYSASFFIITYINNSIVSRVSKTRFNILTNSYNFYITNIKNILYCAFKAKCNDSHMFTHAEYLLRYLYAYVLLLTNYTMLIHDNRNTWPIPFIALLNTCGCKFIKNFMFSNQIDYKVRSVVCFCLTLRYFLTATIFIFFFRNVSLSKFVVLDYKVVMFFCSIIMFSNSVIYYVYDNTWREMILFTCYARDDMKMYNDGYVEEMEKEILVNVGLNVRAAGDDVLENLEA